MGVFREIVSSKMCLQTRTFVNWLFILQNKIKLIKGIALSYFETYKMKQIYSSTNILVHGSGKIYFLIDNMYAESTTHM